MAKKNWRGRPQVNFEAVTVRMLKSELARLDAWMERHLPEGTRPMAIRWLVEIGLGRASPIGRRSPKAGEGDSNGAPRNRAPCR